MNVPHGHDLLFKSALSRNIPVAIDLLHHHLPENIQALVDLNTLRACSGSFIPPELRALHTDVVFSADLKKASKKDKKEPAFFYLHLEEERQADPMMSWRMVKSAVFIMDHHLQVEKKNSVKKKTKQILPIVIPIVFYSGKSKYNYSLDVFDLFGEHVGLARETMFRQFKLVDLSLLPDEVLRTHVWSGLLQMLLKHTNDANFMVFLETVSQEFQRMVQAHLDDYVTVMLNYIFVKANLSDKSLFFDWVRQNLSKKVEVESMTMAEQLRTEGMQQGIQQGMQQGMKQGIQQGMQQGMKQGIEKASIEAAIKIVRHTQDFDLATKITGLSKEKIMEYLD